MGGFGQLGNQEEPQYLNRKGLRSREHNSIAMKSRMMGDHQVRFRERLVVKFQRPTRPCIWSRIFRQIESNRGVSASRITQFWNGEASRKQPQRPRHLRRQAPVNFWNASGGRGCGRRWGRRQAIEDSAEVNRSDASGPFRGPERQARNNSR
jgi:hypothetical protein